MRPGSDAYGAGAHEALDPQVLLERLEQLNDIMPINSAPRRSRSTTASILSAGKACR
jgi:hypothetical protein